MAYSDTTDYNGYCANHGSRLKYKRKSDGSIHATSWNYSVTYPVTYRLSAPVESTAVASEHRSQNGFDRSWSQVERPHAW